MTINILLFLNGTQVSHNHFVNSSTVSNWKSFNLGFKSYTNADSANIVLTSLGYVEVGPRGNSVLYVDNLSFDTLITSVSKDQTYGIPGKFGLNQNYPNPFNPSTTIAFGIPVRSQVTLIIYDLLGKMIATLVNNETMSAGSYSKQWNAAAMPSGVYFYRLQAGSFTETKRLVLLK